MAEKVDYSRWTKDSLIDRVRKLENELKSRPLPPPSPSQKPIQPKQDEKKLDDEGSEEPAPKKRKEKKKMDPSGHSFRYIALKLAYLGRNYGGFEFAANGLLPTIEEELFKALTRACLIFPEDERIVDFTGCEYSKCGRTDRGVSAFGQVIGIKVRSARPLRREKHLKDDHAGVKGGQKSDEMDQDAPEPPTWDPILDEFAYPKLLNRLLPRDIRILAWCPSPPPDFSARFSCKERQYRYFFTQPAFNPPSPSPSQDNVGWLDIDAMRNAAKRFEGTHDFRNFCKIDPTKNITNYHRGILEATIDEVSDVGPGLPYLDPSAAAVGAQSGTYPKIYCFKVRGTAFLWHQIRCMVNILFSVGQRLESPDLVTKLLDIESNPRRPVYVMADETPLVLWDCLFDDMKWVHVEDDVDPGKMSTIFSATDGVWKLWREIKMDEILANGLLRTITKKRTASHTLPDPRPGKRGDISAKLFEGSNSARSGGKYVPIMQKKLMETPQEQTDKFAQRKGFKDGADMARAKAAKFEMDETQDGDE